MNPHDFILGFGHEGFPFAMCRKCGLVVGGGGTAFAGCQFAPSKDGSPGRVAEAISLCDSWLRVADIPREAHRVAEKVKRILEGRDG